jgi:phosphohistidine swiveling domain-containing protein
MTVTDQGEPAAAVLVSLDDPACEAPALAGNKAATLAVLRRAGFEVPPGVVVPADALGGAADELAPGLRLALARVPELLAPGPWAVRSSSTAEDTEAASFAGQFETILGVEADGLADAVRRVWRSAFGDRAKAYDGGRASGSMAVLIQPMVAAAAAGVAFTTDPVSGRHRIVIEAVEGLGERLVSGAATPERWEMEEDGALDAQSLATVLTAEQARAIGELASRVEDHFGRAQDIEWAIAGGSLWLLQARPITTQPSVEAELSPIPIEVPPGYWTRDTFHEPVPISPFGRVLLTEQILKVFPRVFAEFGILLDRAEVAFIGGWMYRREVPLGAPPPGRGRASPPPRWLLKILLRLHPALRRRARAAGQAIASDLPMTVIRRWTEEWRPAHQQEIERGLAIDLGSLTDQELAARLDHRLAVLGHPAHVVVGIAYWILVYELVEACRELLEWDTPKTLTLVEGLSTISTEPARQLAHLAQLAQAKPAVRELLANVDETTPHRLGRVDAEFARAFSDYVEANGRRALRYDVIEPTLAETPHVLLRLVADQLAVEFSPDQVAREALRRRSEAADEARRVLAAHPEADRERFERALARAREAYPTLEDRVWWTFSVQTALLRYLALEIGRRLVERGRLAAIEDVFFLEAQDARSALFDGADHRETARLARSQRAWAMANPGPYAYADRPPEPPLDLLPAPARLVNQGVLWGLAQLFGEPGGVQQEGIVAGTPASAGRYSGTVRVVMGEQQFSKIRPGDVVVCPTTSPAWSVVFPSMGALVTDGGGILSHPAIIAREHGIPAVVGTGNATTALNDGQRVTVDGSRGVVEVADGASSVPDAGMPRTGSASRSAAARVSSS